MKQGEPQLLLNCPKCNSGKLMFARNDDKRPMIECMSCGHNQNKYYVDSFEAVADWNKR